MYCARCKKLVSENQAQKTQKKGAAAYYCPDCNRRLLFLGQERGFVSSQEVLEKYDSTTVQAIPEKLKTVSFERSLIDTRVDELLDVLKYAPDNVNARFDLALIYYSQKELIKAMAEFSEVRRIMPNHEPTLHKLLNIYTAQDDMDKAIEIAVRILEISPKNIEVLFHLALLYLNQEKVDEAETLLQTLIAVDPEHTEANAILEAISPKA